MLDYVPARQTQEVSDVGGPSTLDLLFAIDDE